MDFYDIFSERQKAEEAEAERKGIDNQAAPWLTDTSFDITGYSRPGRREAAKGRISWDDGTHFAHGSTDKARIRNWGRTAEGRAAVAQYAEQNRPKPKLDKRGEMWRFISTTGQVWADSDRQRLIEKVIFGSQSEQQLTGEMKKFLADHPDYTPDPLAWSLLSEHLLMNELFCTAENLAEAWRAIKPEIQTKSREIASQVVEELRQSEDARQREEFSKLTDEQLEEAMRSVSQARRQGLI